MMVGCSASVAHGVVVIIPLLASSVWVRVSESDDVNGTQRSRTTSTTRKQRPSHHDHPGEATTTINQQGTPWQPERSTHTEL